MNHHQMRAWFPMEEILTEFEFNMLYRKDDGELYLSNVDPPFFRAEMELCTGLKDKNGKLIYKGDIVRWHNESEYCKKEYWNPIYRIKHNDSGLYAHFGGFKLEHLNVHGYGLEASSPGFSIVHSKGTFEIIGNIHENPELLEG